MTQDSLPDTDRLIRSAMDSVLATTPEPSLGPPAESAKAQPWAETAAPVARGKRSLEDLLAEYEARVTAAPQAVAGAPAERRPDELFLERLTRRPASRSSRGRRGRQRSGRERPGRDGRPAPGSGQAPGTSAPTGQSSPGGRRRGRGRRRRR